MDTVSESEVRISEGWMAGATRELLEASLTEIAISALQAGADGNSGVVAGVKGLFAALAAERAAHAETRRAWAEMHSAFERARSETDAAGSALASERAAHEETKAGLDAAKRDYEGACHLVAKMHHAATGATQGPVQGVVEDVADVRERLAAAEDCLRELVEKLDEVHANPSYRSVWSLFAAHGCDYVGPTYTKELAKVRAFLAGGKP